MNRPIQGLKVSTPGRICLFGEHQDYLGLPVIACAISLRIEVEGTRRSDLTIHLELPDIGKRESFSLQDLTYTKERDYFKSAVNVLRRNGLAFSSGFDCVVHGSIPINAGTSSSSALVVSWINFLAHMSDQAASPSPETIARWAYEAEVIEFSEPGGMMDQYTTALGGVVGIDSYPELRVTRYASSLKPFVLGNSGEPKDTRSVLARVKLKALNIIELAKGKDPEFSLHTLRVEEADRYSTILNGAQIELLQGVLRNRDITHEAKKVLNETPLNHHTLGVLLNEQQVILRDILHVSTDRLDAMIRAALDAGACGAKINGSGGGGCMFAYVPENPHKVLQAVRKIGEASLVHVEEGTRSDL